MNVLLVEDDPGIGRLVSSYVGQGRYALTSWVNLIAEYTHTMARAHNGNDADSDTIAAGAILFF